MRILIYKRTHVGDPDSRGRFGNEGCMGRVRGYSFDAVIGVGGISGQPRRQGLSGKINWVGRNPRLSRNSVDPRGPLASFGAVDFRLFEHQGPSIWTCAPLLARRVFRNNARFVFRSLTGAEQREAEQLIKRILDEGEFDRLQLTDEVPTSCSDPCNPLLRKRCFKVKTKLPKRARPGSCR